MVSYGALWQARLRLIRPGNVAMAAIGVATGAFLLAPGADTLFVLMPAALAAALITAAGNVVNDVVDLDIDREAHPDRPLPAGTMTRQQAQVLAILLFSFGLWEAYLAAGTRTLAFASLNAGLLILYEAKLKRVGLLGNIIVAALVASTFLFGAFTLDAQWRSWGMVWALAVMAFLTNIARELLKDIQDLEADRLDRRTFPMQAGRPVTLLLAFFLVQVAVALSALAWWRAPAPSWWGILLLLAGLGFVGGASWAWVDVRAGQLVLKVSMLVALAAFLLSTL